MQAHIDDIGRIAELRKELGSKKMKSKIDTKEPIETYNIFRDSRVYEDELQPIQKNTTATFDKFIEKLAKLRESTAV